MRFGEGLQTLRQSAGLTQSVLGQKVGCSRSYISKVEGGQMPSLDFVGKIGQVYELPSRYFYFLALEKPKGLTPPQSAMFDSQRSLLWLLGMENVTLQRLLNECRTPVGSK